MAISYLKKKSLNLEIVICNECSSFALSLDEVENRKWGSDQKDNM